MRQILIAAFNTVHDAGTDAIAELLGKTRGSVAHEVNPPQGGTAKLGIVDAARICLHTRDYRILRAFAEVCGHGIVPLPDWPEGDADVNAILARCGVMAGKFADAIKSANQALVDGKVSKNELDQFLRDSDELANAISNVRSLMISKQDQDAGGRK